MPASEITGPAIYFNRRAFMRAGIVAASAMATGLLYRRLNPVATGTIETPLLQFSGGIRSKSCRRKHYTTLSFRAHEVRSSWPHEAGMLRGAGMLSCSFDEPG